MTAPSTYYNLFIFFWLLNCRLFHQGHDNICEVLIGITIVEFFASLGFEALNSLNLVLMEGLFDFARTFVEDHHKLAVGFANISTE